MLSIINLADSQETEHQSQPTDPQCSKLSNQVTTEIPSSDPVMMEIDLMEDDPTAPENLAEKSESVVESETCEIQGQEQTKEGIFDVHE